MKNELPHAVENARRAAEILGWPVYHMPWLEGRLPAPPGRYADWGLFDGTLYVSLYPAEAVAPDWPAVVEDPAARFGNPKTVYAAPFPGGGAAAPIAADRLKALAQTLRDLVAAVAAAAAA